VPVPSKRTSACGANWAAFLVLPSRLPVTVIRPDETPVRMPGSAIEKLPLKSNTPFTSGFSVPSLVNALVLIASVAPAMANVARLTKRPPPLVDSELPDFNSGAQPAGKTQTAPLAAVSDAPLRLGTPFTSNSLPLPSKNQCVLPSNLPANVTFPPLIARMIVE